MARDIRFFLAIAALAFLGAHVWFFPRSLGDIDTINFALGVEHFDVRQHRPHPPGYPVFVAMGKASTAALEALAPSWDRTERAAVGLATWGVAAGSIGVWIFTRFWLMLGWTPMAAWAAAALALASPLFWFTAARPLTDVVALVAAVAVQCGLLRAWRGVGADASSARIVVAGAAAAGLLIGLRTQTMWLTGPLLLVVVARDVHAGAWREAGRLLGAALAGVLVWAIPLVWTSGGLDAYLGALFIQGADDFRAVPMLATTPDAVLLGERLVSTFVAPWRVEWLGETVTLLAAVGAIATARRNGRALAIVLVAFVPYLIFHLLFQDVDTVRYALPIVVPVAGLAVHALSLLPQRAVPVLRILLVCAALVVAFPGLRRYHSDVPPTFLAFKEAAEAAAGAEVEPLVVTHDGMRRVADWFRPEWPSLPAQRPNERVWLRLVDHFRRGATGPAWFLADRRRSHAVLFDHRSRRVVKEYLRDPAVRHFIGQTRQDEVRWWELRQPGWMLGQGWALSPDLGAIAFADGREPHQKPASGFLRRAPGPHRLMVGGRCLACTSDGELVVDIDGVTIARWPIRPREPWFLLWIDVPGERLAGDGPYASLAVRVEPATGGVAPRVELAQFDFAPADQIMAALSDGWHEAEADTETGQTWRWSGERATMTVYGMASGARLLVAGASTLRDFERASIVTVRANGVVVRQFEARADFSETIALPASSVDPSIVTIETDQAFVPAERGQSADRRRLGLRLSRVDIRP